LTWESSLRFPEVALSLVWRGKHSQSPDWLRRCKTAPWLRHLFGAMCAPSPADDGAASWMASLAESRASPTLWPVNEKAPQTSEISGQPLGASSRRPDLGGSSSKTSEACSPPNQERFPEQSGFGETYAAWALRLREDSLRRRKSARRISARGFSSSLSEIALGSAWPTPAARDGKGVDRTDIDRGNARPLNEVASIWSTPRASDGEKGGPGQSFGAGGIPLPAQSINWQTPTVGDVTGGHSSRSAERKSEPLLNEQARALSWATPWVEMSRALGNEKHITANRSKGFIEDQTATWPTPTSLSFDGSHQPGNNRGANITLEIAEADCFRPAPANEGLGEPSPTVPPNSSRRSLSPIFVEWLMNWPPGWVCLGSINSDYLEMEWCLWWQHTHCALLALRLPDEHDIPQQLDLFG
jgi:hypothetical protein